MEGVTDAVYVDESGKIAIFPGLTVENGKTRSTIYLADVSRPDAPVLLARLPIAPLGETSAFFALPSQKRLYLAHFVQGVVVVNYGDPTSPFISNIFAYPGYIPADYSVYCLFGKYPYLFVPYNFKRLQVYDLSTNPDDPAIVASIDPFPYRISDGAASDNILVMVADGTRILVADILGLPVSNPVLATSLETDGYESSPAGVSLSPDGKSAWVADFAKGLRKLDLADPSNVTVTARENDYAGTLKISRDGNLIGLARGSLGVSLLEESPSGLDLVAQDDSLGFAMNIHLSGNYAYVAMRDGGIKIVRVR